MWSKFNVTIPTTSDQYLHCKLMSDPLPLIYVASASHTHSSLHPTSELQIRSRTHLSHPRQPHVHIPAWPANTFLYRYYASIQILAAAPQISHTPPFSPHRSAGGLQPSSSPSLIFWASFPPRSLDPLPRLPSWQPVGRYLVRNLGRYPNPIPRPILIPAKALT